MSRIRSASVQYVFWLVCCSLLTIVAQAQVSVSIGQNFTGSTYNLNVQSVPPDSNGEIGPRHFMEFINGTVAIYDKTNGVTVQRKTNLKFWSDSGLIISPDSGVSDPRVIFDPRSQRWFAVQVDFTSTAADPTLNANDFLIAVSATSDPTGAWRGFSFQADPATGTFADFPTMGLDANAMYLSGDMYHGGTNPVGAELVSIPKAGLIAATPTIANRTSHGVLNYAARGQVLQPAICFDGSSTGNVLGMGDIGNDSAPHSNIVCSVVLNGGAPTATLAPAISINVSPYVVPFNSDLVTPLFNPTQPDGTTNIMANEARLSGKVYAVNGSLYAAHSTEVNNRIAVRWYRINATNHVLLESGTIADANLDLFFPSIAANTNGVVVIGCNGSSINTFVSCFAIAGATANGVTKFGNPVLLQSGQTSYHGDDEVLQQLLDQPAFSRWGDYSATAVDPVDPNRFWTIQMFPSDSANEDVWSTRITELITVINPTLTITRSNANVVVSWPLLNATGFNLESNTNIVASNNWTVISQNLSTNSGRIVYQTPLTNSLRFFRLHKP